jgi:uncharacterized protein
MIEYITLTYFTLFFLIAFLYASVGHAGASGYLALMSLLSFPILEIKPTSLVLNIVVATIASYKFISEGYFDKKIFIPFIITSIPAAFIGGAIDLDPYWFKWFAGLFLLLSAAALIFKNKQIEKNEIRELPVVTALLVGAVIGLFSGLIGVGGGIFLSPLIVVMGWTSIKKASGVSALFILCNSIIGLAGHVYSNQFHQHDILYWIVAVSIGGYVGAHMGAKQYANKVLVAILFLILCSAGLKFLLV